jgi:hypothetical protein
LAYTSQSLLTFGSSILNTVQLIERIEVVGSPLGERVARVALLLMLLLIKLIFIFDLHLSKHTINLDFGLDGLLLNTYSAFLLRLVMLLLNIYLLFADWTSVLGLKPLSYTSLMEPVETHKHHVLLTNFVVRLANSAQFVFFGEV